jgi:hypothetical protein
VNPTVGESDSGFTAQVPGGGVGVRRAAIDWLTSVFAPSCRKPLPITTTTTPLLFFRLKCMPRLLVGSLSRNSARMTQAAPSVFGP